MWSETDNSKTTASRYTGDGVRASVMQFIGNSWELGDGVTLGDGNYLGQSADGKGEGVYKDYTVTAGNLYTFSALHRVGHSDAYLTIQIYDQSNDESISSVNVNATSWTTRSERITAPFGCSTIRVKFLQKSDVAYTGPFFVDNVALNESGIVYDPDDYSYAPEVIGAYFQTLGGRRVHDQRGIHYDFLLRWEYLEKAQVDLLRAMFTQGETIYFDDSEVPYLTESEVVSDTAEEDYVGVTNPSSTNKAYTDNSSSLPSAEGDFDSTEYSTAGYGKIDGDDANYHQTTNPTAGNYLYHRFDFDGGIARASVNRFRVLVKASCDDASPDNIDGCILYAWNDVDAGWVEVARSSSSAKTSLAYSTAESDVAQSYIDSSTQRVKLLLRSVASRTSGQNLTLRTYYAELELNEGLDLTVDLSHRAVLTSSDVIYVKNLTQSITMKNLVEYEIASDRRSIAVEAVYATLNGSSHRFQCGNVLDGVSGDLSLSAWMKMDGAPANNSIIAQKYDGSVGYSLYIANDGRLVGYIEDAGDSVSSGSGSSICDNVWHHVAVTFDRDGNMVRYVDGAVYGTPDDISSISGDISNSSNFTIGSNSAGNNFFFEGSLRDVRIIIGTVWSAANMVTQAANPVDKSVGGSNTSNWYFTDAAGDTDITDDTASNDLTLVGGTTTNYGTHTRDRVIDSGDTVEVQYNRYWEVAFSGMPERYLGGNPSGDRVRNVTVLLKTLSETPIN